MSLTTKLKIFGLVLGLFGLIAGLLDLKGYFRDKDKIALAEAIHSKQGGISKDERGFEKFLKRFPPKNSVDEKAITHIVKDKLQTHDGYPISVALRYLINSNRSSPVATYAEVKKWAETTNYNWWSWLIALAGWILVISLEAIDVWQQNKKRHSPVSEDSSEQLVNINSEKEVALTIAAILIAIAAFSLPIMVLCSKPKETLANEIFGFIGLFSIIGSSLLIDWLFDDLKYPFLYRLKMMNKGYTFFSTVISLICSSIFIFYNYQEGINISWHYLFYLFPGVCTFGKIMTYDKKEHWFIFLCIFYISSILITLISLYIAKGLVRPLPR